ncbi:unnamed protein product, partial [Meganyctiphanes norvegica]
MVLEEETPSTQKITTEDFSIPGQDSVYSKEEKSDRESQKFKVAKQTLYSSEKGCTRGQIDIGSINSQLIHPLSTFQDANNERGEATLAQGLLDGLHRPKGRVLACRHIQNKRPYLGFRYRNQDWQFRAMPFGLNIAPRMFTKVIAHVVKMMAEAGIWCLPYLDDLLIIASTREECIRMSELAISILETLGWILNKKKSRLVPAQVFEWLGVHFDLVSHTAQASSEKVTCFQQKLRSVITSRFCSKRVIMQLQGQCNWISRCDPVVRLMMSETKSILRYFRRQDLDSPLELDRERRLSLCRWVTDISIPQTLGAPAPDIIVQTDASLTGWGFLIDRIPFSGVFDPSMAYSINILELLTVWYSLLMIAEEGAVIHILSDSLVAVSIVRRGTSPVHHLSALADLIWRRAALFRWTLSISHIEGNFNVIADQLSRKEALSTEWSLQHKDFQKILDLNPNLEVDLFATSLNYQLENYVSPCPDADAIAVDALTTQWDQWDHLYLYP